MKKHTVHKVDITGVYIPESEWETTRIWRTFGTEEVEIDFDRDDIVETWDEPEL